MAVAITFKSDGNTSGGALGVSIHTPDYTGPAQAAAAVINGFLPVSNASTGGDGAALPAQYISTSVIAAIVQI